MSTPTPMHWAHWLWMGPVAVALSPIGTIAFTKWLGLDFIGCLKLMWVQFLAFALLCALAREGGTT